MSGVRSFEEQRLDQLDAKRQARKTRSVHPTAAVTAGVWINLCIGVQAAITPDSPVTLSLLCDGLP